MVQDIRLLALDIDGTLTHRADGQVNQRAIAAVRTAQADGIQVALISARPPQGVARIARLLDGACYQVSYFGALIQNPAGNDLQRLVIDSTIAREIAHFADQHAYSIMINLDDTEYHTRQHARDSAAPRIPVDTAAEVLAAGTPPVLMSFEGAEPAAAFDQYYQQQQYSGQVALYRHFDNDGGYVSALAVHPQVQKGNALVTVCRLLEIAPRDVLAAGDSESDISMFQVAGVGVAVADADRHVRDAAAYVAPEPDGDGVVWALRTLLHLPV